MSKITSFIRLVLAPLIYFALGIYFTSFAYDFVRSTWRAAEVGGAGLFFLASTCFACCAYLLKSKEHS